MLSKDIKTEAGELTELIQSIKTRSEKESREVFIEINKGLESARNEIGEQIKKTSEELVKTKAISEKSYSETQKSLETKLSGYSKEMDLKIRDMFKETDKDIESKKSELKEITNDLLRQFGEREKDLGKRIEKMNGLIDITVKKAEDELKNIQKTLSGRFDEAYAELRMNGENGVDVIKTEIASISGKLKTEAMGDIENIRKQLNDVNKTAENFEKDILSKIEASNKNYSEEILLYRKTIEELKSECIQIDSAVKDTVKSRAKEAEEYIISIKDVFMTDYATLTGKVKNDASQLADLIESVREKAELDKKEVLDEINMELRVTRDDIGGQIEAINQELSNTKAASEKELAGLQKDIEEKIKIYKHDLDIRVTSIVKESDKDLTLRKAELKDLSNDLVKQFGEKEKDLGKRIEKMNGLIDNTVIKAEDELKNIQQSLAGKFDEAYSELRMKGEDGVGIIKSEIAAITGKLKAEALSDIENIREQLKDVNKSVDDLKTECIQVDNAVKDAVKSRSKEAEDYIISIKDTLSADYSSLSGKIKNETAQLSDLIESVREKAELDKKEAIEEFNRELHITREDIGSQVESIREEMQKTKAISDKELEKLQLEISEKINNYKYDIDSKISSIIKDSDKDLALRKTELKDLSGELVKQFGEREKDLGKRIEKMNGLIDSTVKKAEDELKNIQQSLSSRFEEAYGELREKGSAGIDIIKTEIGAITGNLKNEALVDIENIKVQLDSMNKNVTVFEKDITIRIETINKNHGSEIGTYKQNIDLLKNECAKIELAIKDAVKTGTKDAEDYVREVSEEIKKTKSISQKEMESFQAEIGEKINNYKYDIESKISSIIKDSDKDLAMRKTELKDLSGELVKQFGEKEKDLGKRIEKMNGLIDNTVKKAEDELKNIQQSLSSRFDEAYGELKKNGSAGIDLIKADIGSIYRQTQV